MKVASVYAHQCILGRLADRATNQKMLESVEVKAHHFITAGPRCHVSSGRQLHAGLQHIHCQAAELTVGEAAGEKAAREANSAERNSTWTRLRKPRPDLQGHVPEASTA